MAWSRAVSPTRTRTARHRITRSTPLAAPARNFAFRHAEAYRLMFMVTQKDAEAKDPALQRAVERARATMSYHVKQMVKEGLVPGPPMIRTLMPPPSSPLI